MAEEARIVIEPARAEDGDRCVGILRALPAWFGIEEAVQHYAADLREMETFVARSDGQIIGFLTLNEHNDVTAEVHLMAVHPEWHRQGIGRALIRHAEDISLARGRRLLEVKTLGPSHPDEGYRKTRTFYEAMGFLPLEEIHDLWPGNPCLIMVKVIGT